MIQIICGTNRNDALSLQVSKIYQSILKELGHDSNIIDLTELPEDFVFTALYDNAGKNPAFNSFRETMTAAEKQVFVVPEYNGSFPGVLKAFIDGLKFPDTFTNKKAALIGVSSGVQGAGLALSHLTDIFNYCGMHVLAYKVKLMHIEDHLNNDVLGEEYMKYLKRQAKAFTEF